MQTCLAENLAARRHSILAFPFRKLANVLVFTFAFILALAAPAAAAVCSTVGSQPNCCTSSRVTVRTRVMAGLMHSVTDGDELLVDGHSGIVIVLPAHDKPEP